MASAKMVTTIGNNRGNRKQRPLKAISVKRRLCPHNKLALQSSLCNQPSNLPKYPGLYIYTGSLFMGALLHISNFDYVRNLSCSVYPTQVKQVGTACIDEIQMLVVRSGERLWNCSRFLWDTKILPSSQLTTLPDPVETDS